MYDYDAAVHAAARLAVRHFQHYSAEQRADRAASHRLGPQQRRDVGETFYTHPQAPGRAFPTRRAAGRAAADAEILRALLCLLMWRSWANEPRRVSMDPAELHKHFKVLYKPTGQVFRVLGGDTRYEATGPGVWDYRSSPTGDGVLLWSAVHMHPWGWVAPLADLAPAPDGSGMYHPDHIAGMMQLQLEMSYEGSWRQHADAESFVSGWAALDVSGGAS